MDKAKQKRLEAKGFKVGTVAEFLDLSPADCEYIEVKLRLSDALRERRKKMKLSQTATAQKLKSSQSRVAKMEASDPSVSLDLYIRSLIELGVSRRDLGRIVASR